MPYLPISIPPGVVRPGTVYDSKGHWYDTNLVRWFDGSLQPIGGWETLVKSDDSDINVGGPARGVLGWRDNSGQALLALGTPTKLYIYTTGVLTDVTPAGLTTGNADATQSTGAFGDGAFGAGLFGSGDTTQITITEAQTWQFDNFGEDLVGVAYSDGSIWYWDRSAGGAAAALSNAPTNASGVVVTPEGFVVALGVVSDGAGGWTAEGRGFAWSDQRNATTWAASITNQAGDYTLPGNGEILAGRRSRTETLLWTDTGVFAMRYIGGDYVYTTRELGSGCGAISRGSMVVLEDAALWMSHRGFFAYDGYVREIPCPVGDYVFNDLNRVQASKIWCETRSEYGEIIWHYPSAGSTEIDRYVVFNKALGVWYIGSLDRTAGIDRGAFQHPIMCDSNGAVYQHEIGSSYLDTDGTTSLTIYAESGPIEVGEGDKLLSIRQIIPDEKTLGDVQAYVYTSNYPTADETKNGPYTLSNPTSVRLTARQMRLRVEQVDAGWRVGTFRLEGVLSGRR